MSPELENILKNDCIEHGILGEDLDKVIILYKLGYMCKKMHLSTSIR